MDRETFFNLVKISGDETLDNMSEEMEASNYNLRVFKNLKEKADAILNGVEHANFFENRATEYTRVATQGSWSDVF